MIPPTSIYRPDLEMVVAEFSLEARGLVADRIFPFLPSRKKAGPINKLLGSYVAQTPGVSIKRASRASAARGELKSSVETFAAERYTFEMPWDDEDEDDFFTAQQLEQMNAATAEAVVRAELEADVASILFNITNFPLTGTTGLDGVTAWSNLASATPRANVHQGWRSHRPAGGSLPLEAYGLIMNSDVAQYVNDGAEFQTSRSTGFRPQDGSYKAAELMAHFGVGEITIANSSRNTAALGVSASYANIWSSTYVGLYVIPGRGNAGLQRGAGRIVQWDKAGRGNAVAIDQYREEPTTTNVVRAEGHWDAVLLNNQDFFLIDIV
jgi:hypothetical protein